ncbi:O-antigen ligase family protein [Candidatus Magnetominusculus dajiuhuensis]|uniref:O-antigen ligase family protein n=1 Tax=Candidatus Magnetominusculus dajiuhuensis TaxID=3137712 RepID=UPI003B432711
MKDRLWKARLLTPVVVIFSFGYGMRDGALVLPFQCAFLFLNLLIFNVEIFTSHKQNNHETDDIRQMIFIIFIYMSLSFLINSFYSLLDPNSQLYRLKSFMVSLHFLLFYYIGSFYSYNTDSLLKLMKRIFWTLSIMLVYFILKGINGYFSIGGDLMALRGILIHRYIMVFIFAATISFALLSLTNNRILKVSVVMVFVLSVFIGLASMTRSIIIQILSSVIALIYFSKNKSRILFYSSMILIVVAALTFVSGDFKSNCDNYFFRAVYSRINALINVPHSLTEGGDDSERYRIWMSSIKPLLDNPMHLFFGFGELGVTYYAEGFVDNGFLDSGYNAHSQFIDILARGGIIGLVLYATFFIKIIQYGAKKAKAKAGFANELWKYLTIGLIGVLFYSFGHETLRFPYFAYLFWFLLGAYSSPLVRKGACENLCAAS